MQIRSNIDILIFVPSLKAGGMERVAATLANYWCVQGEVNVHLAVLTGKESFYKLHNDVNLYITHLREGWSFPKLVKETIIQLRKLIKEIKPDAILSFGDRYNSLPIVANLFLPFRLYVSNRQSPLISNGRMVDLMNWIFYRFSNGIIAQTRVAAEIFSKKYKPKHISVIGNPFLVPDIQPLQRENIILNVGRFADQKNQFELIQIFENIKNPENWRLQFIGEGPKIERTKEVLELSEKKDCIQIIGFTDRVNEYYQKASIFCMTSRTEGFPNVIGEAMSNGVPVIAYDCIAGPSDLIDDGINGFLIPVGDHDQFQKKLELLMNDANLRDSMGRNAQEKMKQFSLERIAQQYLDFILQG